jgi:hypothetical protein
VPLADRLLIVPGNQRIRIFDFAQGTSRVLQKRGFSGETFAREIELRGGGKEGPFVAIERHGEDWFEERLFDGYCLPRCPPWISRRHAEEHALALLGEWLATSATPVSAHAVIGTLVARIERGVTDLEQKFVGRGYDALLRLVNALAPRAQELGIVTTALGHGDFQPGNILVSRDSKTVRIIDWEHSAVRSSTYDYLVYGLQTRSPAGLASRLEKFMAGSVPRGVEGLAFDKHRRTCSLALFLLEDLTWFVEESLTGPFRVASQALERYQVELARFAWPLHLVSD